jgi:ketol-acid reductoisomerase
MPDQVAFSDRVLELANEVFVKTLDDIQAGEFQNRFWQLSTEERKGLYRAIADAFNADTDE